MTNDIDNIAQLLVGLENVSRRLALALLAAAELAPAGAESTGAWSPAQILAHLRASHAIVQPRVFCILARDKPNLAAYDERVWQQVARLDNLPVGASIQLLILSRNELLVVLQNLTPYQWQRTGTHEVAGTITIIEIVRDLIAHDEEHLAQLEALL